jgi:hypothetical protein
VCTIGSALEYDLVLGRVTRAAQRSEYPFGLKSANCRLNVAPSQVCVIGDCFERDAGSPRQDDDSVWPPLDVALLPSEAGNGDQHPSLAAREV